MAESKKPMQSRRRPKATTPEAREKQLISLAYDQAEEHLRNGTASQQLITHFLKLGSTRDELEKKMIANKTKLLDAQVENLESQRRSEELYEKALDAMRRYAGHSSDGDDTI